MEKRDYIEDQINLLSKVFAKILSILGKAGNSSDLQAVIVAGNESLKNEIGINNLLNSN